MSTTVLILIIFGAALLLGAGALLAYRLVRGHMPHFTRKALGIPYAVFLIFFVIAPMLVILVYAFTDRNMHFSFANFVKFFSDPTKLSTIAYSIVIALITTAVCLLIAFPVAYILARSKMKKKYVILMLFVLPMWINFVLRINAIR